MALITVAFAQQPGPVQYVYDALGRLVKVIDGEGNIAEYVYDAVGNILEMRRSTLSGLAIVDFSPRNVPVGTVVNLRMVNETEGVGVLPQLLLPGRKSYPRRPRW